MKVHLQSFFKWLVHAIDIKLHNYVQSCMLFAGTFINFHTKMEGEMVPKLNESQCLIQIGGADLFIFSHGGNRNKQRGHVPLMWLAALSSGLAVL